MSFREQVRDDVQMTEHARQMKAGEACARRINTRLRCASVLPSPSISAGCACCERRKTTMSSLPSRIAQWSGVDASSPPTASTSARLLIRYLAMSTRLLIAAQCSNVMLSPADAETKCGAASMSSTTRSRYPYCTALATVEKSADRCVRCRAYETRSVECASGAGG